MRELRSSGSGGHEGAESSGPAPGKRALTDRMPVQRKSATASAAESSGAASEAPRSPTRIDAAESADPFDFSFPPLASAARAGDGADEEDLPIGGAATTMSTGELAAATWSDEGRFKWWVNWVTDGTSGWIVQKITNTYSGSKKDGTAITNASVGAIPSYYEAWEVDKDGKITGSLGKTGNRDKWERPALGEGSKGSWSMTGNVYWTGTDPAASGFKSKGVSNAGSLLSSLTAPKDLSGELQTRKASGTWDASAGSHKGAAK